MGCRAELAESCILRVQAELICLDLGRLDKMRRPNVCDQRTGFASKNNFLSVRAAGKGTAKTLGFLGLVNPLLTIRALL